MNDHRDQAEISKMQSSTAEAQGSASSSSVTKPSNARSSMKWDEAKDICLLKEATMQNPFLYRKGSSERGKIWSSVAAVLQKQGFKVDQRAVRDRYNFLQKKMKRKNVEDQRASGLGTAETDKQGELRQLLEDLGNQEEDAEQLPKQNEEEKKRDDGREVQKRACESFVETRKRLSSTETDTQPKKKRNTGGDTLVFLQQKLEMERELKSEELALRKAEIDRKELEEVRHNKHLEQLQTQQLQMQQQFLQLQQQTQNMMVMMMQTLSKNSNEQ